MPSLSADVRLPGTGHYADGFRHYGRHCKRTGRRSRRLSCQAFSFQELEARIKALLRRNKETVTNQLTCDNLVLDCNTRRAKRGDADIDLTVKEYRLLEYFMTHQGVALSRITLLKDVWDKNFDTNTNIVDVYVNYLRVKIDRDFDKKLIHTVVGLGYIMNA